MASISSVTDVVQKVAFSNDGKAIHSHGAMHLWLLHLILGWWLISLLLQSLGGLFVQKDIL